MKHSKWLTTGLMALFFGTGLAVANDAENEAKSSVDRSRNPITGTVTVTKKSKQHHTARNGAEVKSEKKEVTKYKKDGTVEKKEHTEDSTEPSE